MVFGLSGLALVARVASACAPPHTEVPVLASVPPPKTTPSASSAGTPARAIPTPAGPKCLDPKITSAAHVCPPGAAGDYTALLRAESALLAARPTPTKKSAKDPFGPARPPRVFTAAETSYVEQAQRFVCSQPKGSLERTEATYGLARIYFAANHWDEAAELFHAVADTSDADTAPFAAQLSLECLNVLGAHFDRPECFDTLSEWTKAYHERFCGAKMRPENGEMCTTLGKILVDLTRRRSG